MKIGNKTIGSENPCFIIAEAGVNHNGDINIAKRLIDAAKESGADAVKFQTFNSEELATSKVDKAEYQKENSPEKSQLDMLKALELSKDEFRELKSYCETQGIIFLSTPFDSKSSDFLDELGVPAFKISSGDLNNYPFLSHIAKKGKPMIVSTGMATLDEIEIAVKTIREEKNNDIVLLQCTTAYPAPFKDVNLNAMKTLKEKFNIPIGFSDHTPGIEASIAAVALGACLIEKHFTLDKTMDGPDHKASIDPDELKAMVKSIKNVELALGSFDKRVMPSEEKNMIVARKKIVAGKEISQGTEILENMLAFKRSGVGLDPANIGRVVGKKVKRDIKKDEPISLEDLE